MPTAVLIVEHDEVLLASQVMLLEAQGYEVLPAGTRALAEKHLSGHCPDAAVIGHSVERDDREILVAKARLIRPDTRILVLHASGARLPVVPHAAIDSREGPESVLLALAQLLSDCPVKKPPAKQAAADHKMSVQQSFHS
jgi:ActR/RegA family two-component response regulator